MKKIRVAQIGTSKYSHGNGVFDTVKKYPGLFEIAGYHFPENEREKFPENMKAFEYVLKRSKSPAIWAAWGTIIEKRPYLPLCVSDMIELGEKYSAEWFTSGKISAKGHPHHPLYLKKDSPLDKFDIKAYTADILNFKK